MRCTVIREEASDRRQRQSHVEARLPGVDANWGDSIAVAPVRRCLPGWRAQVRVAIAILPARRECHLVSCRAEP